MIVIIAPYPFAKTVREGWRARIAAIDKIFEHKRRLYINITHDLFSDAPEHRRVSNFVEVYDINPAMTHHYDIMRSAIIDADAVYVHTIHLARYVLPFYKLKKIITDIHGLAPEEECYLNKSQASVLYSSVEKIVFASGNIVIVVTQAMADHFQLKYPESHTKMIVLPIVDIEHSLPVNRISRADRPRVIYSGGFQDWQKVPLMLEAAQRCREWCDFSFISGDELKFFFEAESYGLTGHVDIRTVPKNDLVSIYQAADYGFILRDDNAINRVACPTKLSEYLEFGIIPIILSESIGDFQSLGYRYIRFEDFINRQLPSDKERECMIRENQAVVGKIKNMFKSGYAVLLTTIDGMSKINVAPVEYLTDYERNVIFPAMSELLLFSKKGMLLQKHGQYFVTHYKKMEFDLENSYAKNYSLEWMPIDQACKIKITSINLIDSNGKSAEFSISGNYSSFRNSLATFFTPCPILRMRLRKACIIRKAIFEIEIFEIGMELYYNRRVDLRKKVKNFLKRYPVIVKIYIFLTRYKLLAGNRIFTRSTATQFNGPSYPSLQHFSRIIGISADTLCRAFEIEKVFHKEILSEQSYERRSELYRDVYSKVIPLFESGKNHRDECRLGDSKRHYVWLFERELKNKSLLDVGCGDGSLLICVSRFLAHKKLMGIDICTPSNCSFPDIRFLQHDIVLFQVEEKFEVVFLDNVIEHIVPQDLDMHLESIRVALKSGGTLIVLTPNRLFGPWDVTRIIDDTYTNAIPAQGTHVNEMTCVELISALRKSGFSRFRTVLPLAKIFRHVRWIRIPAVLYVFFEHPIFIKFMHLIPNKWKITGVFEITIICTKE